MVWGVGSCDSSTGSSDSSQQRWVGAAGRTGHPVEGGSGKSPAGCTDCRAGCRVEGAACSSVTGY